MEIMVQIACAWKKSLLGGPGGVLGCIECGDLEG